MALIQLLGVALAIFVLLGLSFFFGWRELLVLRGLHEHPALPAEEGRSQRRQGYCRLTGCGLMVLLALLLAGAQLFLEDKALALAVERDALVHDGTAPPLTPEQTELARLYTYYWIVCLLVLLAIVVLAGTDLWTTRRRGLRERRKLLDEQRTMVAREVERFRQERKGNN